MCQGLPGSGKTTWAQNRVAEQQYADIGPAVRVNKDDIRRELERIGWTWSRENESQVIIVRDSRITSAFQAGATTVISDDTNFGRRHKVELQNLARCAGAMFKVHKFDTPVDECIRRDALRTGKARVGAAVIQKMAAQYGLATAQEAPGAPIPVVADPLLPPAVICDLDGTLSLFKAKGHRGPYDASRCAEDECNEAVRMLLHTYQQQGVNTLYVSGREDTYRPHTMTFLSHNNCPVVNTRLWMRQRGDKRNDALVKSDIFDAHIRGKFNIQLVLDDRDRVVKFWRSIGLQCWQVAEGNF